MKKFIVTILVVIISFFLIAILTDVDAGTADCPNNIDCGDKTAVGYNCSAFICSVYEGGNYCVVCQGSDVGEG